MSHQNSNKSFNSLQGIVFVDIFSARTFETLYWLGKNDFFSEKELTIHFSIIQ